MRTGRDVVFVLGSQQSHGLEGWTCINHILNMVEKLQFSMKNWVVLSDNVWTKQASQPSVLLG